MHVRVQNQIIRSVLALVLIWNATSTSRHGSGHCDVMSSAAAGTLATWVSKYALQPRQAVQAYNVTALQSSYKTNPSSLERGFPFSRFPCLTFQL